jgi:LmbE family N-acetylglucosaminyl deacetylase
MTTTIAGDGTAESVWASWLDEQPWQHLDLSAVAGRRVVVLAAHPDDEVLAVGGLLSALSLHSHKIVMVWATDGEASHPGSTAMSPAELRTARPEESQRALRRLGVDPVATHRLGFPDGGLAASPAALRSALGAIVCPGDVVLAPWTDDGHPDHDALGGVAQIPGTTTWYYPIWLWHWAEPGEQRVPWQRFRYVAVPDLDAKRTAIAEFVTQTEPLGPAVTDAAILPPHVIARFRRAVECVIV